MIYCRYMKGGADTGFRRVVPEEYVPRLFEVKKEGRKIFSKEVCNIHYSLCTSHHHFILFDWVYPHTDTVLVIWPCSSLTGGGRPQVPFRA
jgi:hypothetical protein